MLAYAAAILLSAFLLFQIQPIVAKAILAWFGGSPAVWTTCMLFFQVLLLGGYAYAHLSTTVLSRRARAAAHVLLLGLTLFWLPISVDPAWKPAAGEDPALRILGLLATSIGAPYFALSATAPLLQSWAAAAEGGLPYRLYALSNAGSLAALLSYPVLVEPWLATGAQLRSWSLGYGVFTVLSAAAALRYLSRSAATPEPAATFDTSEIPGPSRIALWAALPACASVLLLAVTNQVCQEVAVIPFLWILPLTLYLLSFILCFESDRWYDRRFFLPSLLILSVAVVATLFKWLPFQVRGALVVYAAYLFAACMVCHGEVVRLRPGASFLTLFYLMVSLGGAAGGIFVALLAPRLFHFFFELHIGIVLCLILAPLAAAAGSRGTLAERRLLWLSWVAASVMIAELYADHAWKLANSGRSAGRNFYGTLRVRDQIDANGRRRSYLVHGATIHGFEFAGRPSIATTYYAPTTGVGRLLTKFRSGWPRRIGAVGLGVGTIAAYAERVDTLHFFEINPLAVDLAQTQFGFLHNCRGAGYITVGDGRLALEARADERYDVLVLDAFTSDAIPVHLLTEQAFRLYAARLADGGAIAIHLTNRTLDLVPVVAAAATAIGFDGVVVRNPVLPSEGAYAATWAILSKDPGSLRSLFGADGAALTGAAREPILWRDDYSNLFRILK